MSKNPKFQSNFDSQGECDGVKSQLASEIRYEGVNKVGKQPKGKTRSYEEKSKPKVSIRFPSWVASFCWRKISLRTGRYPQRDRLLTLRQKVLIMVTDLLLYLGGLVCEREGENKYLLPVFVPARSGLSSNLSLFDKPCRQTKYDHFLLYQD